MKLLRTLILCCCCGLLCCAVCLCVVLSGKAAELLGYVLPRYPLCNPLDFWRKLKLRCVLDLEMLCHVLTLPSLYEQLSKAAEKL